MSYVINHGSRTIRLRWQDVGPEVTYLVQGNNEENPAIVPLHNGFLNYPEFQYGPLKYDIQYTFGVSLRYRGQRGEHTTFVDVRITPAPTVEPSPTSTPGPIPGTVLWGSVSYDAANKRINLSWSQPAPPASVFALEHRKNGGAWSLIGDSVYTTGGTSTTHYNVQADGARHEYRVRGLNNHFQPGPYSSIYSLRVPGGTPTPTATPSLKPTLGVTHHGGYVNYLVIGGFDAAVYFKIIRRYNPWPSTDEHWTRWSTLIGRTGGVNYDDQKEIHAGYEYEYRVRALNALSQGIGQWSDVASVRVPGTSNFLTSTPTPTRYIPPSPKPTRTRTPIPDYTSTPTNTPASEFTATATHTPRSSVPTATATHTPRSSALTATATHTPRPPVLTATATHTPRPPAPPPTATATHTPRPPKPPPPRPTATATRTPKPPPTPTKTPTRVQQCWWVDGVLICLNAEVTVTPTATPTTSP